jgi:protein-tyrosine phosphatase
VNQTARIICICSGNICRSPMAAVLLKEKLQARNQAAVIISAGTLGLTGHRAADHARTAVAELGLSLEGHRSQGISLGLLRMADQLVIMSTRHEQAILALDPALEGRIVRLWHYDALTRDGDSIPDPVGQDLETFRECRELLDRSLEAWLDERYGCDESASAPSLERAPEPTETED